MRRVLVIGPGGAGKSTLANAIGAATGLPVVHLDQHYWGPGWRKPSDDEWRARVGDLVDAPAWVMDGNYSDTLDLRMEAADAVVFLDRSAALCLWRILLRRLRHRNGRKRPDMAEGCPEGLTWEFLWWVGSYGWRVRPGVLRRLAALGDGTRTYRLRSDADVRRCLEELSLSPTV